MVGMVFIIYNNVQLVHLSTRNYITFRHLSFWGPTYKLSYDNLMIMPQLRSTYNGHLIYKTSYNEWKAFHR